MLNRRQVLQSTAAATLASASLGLRAQTAWPNPLLDGLHLTGNLFGRFDVVHFNIDHSEPHADLGIDIL